MLGHRIPVPFGRRNTFHTFAFCISNINMLHAGTYPGHEPKHTPFSRGRRVGDEGALTLPSPQGEGKGIYKLLININPTTKNNSMITRKFFFNFLFGGSKIL